MEDKNKLQEDFQDFEEEDIKLPEIPVEKEELEDFKEEDEDNIDVPEIEQDETESLDSEAEEEKADELSVSAEEFDSEQPEQQLEEQQTEENINEENNQQEISQWEELDDENSVVKKYIVYISKDFVPYIDSLSVDQRTAYINDAIQMKLDSEDVQKQEQKKRKLKTHFILAILTFCIMTPIALLGVNKAIMLTFENYKYSQDNFEKLYKQKFEKDKVFMRSLQYNKELEKRNKASH